MLAPMKWVTLAHVHLDRVAAPWLIRRFVDPAADFGFVEWGHDGQLPDPSLLAHVPEGATPVGMPGATPLGLHDADGSCFAKVLRAYDLTDPALWRMERLVAAGIRHAFGKPPAADETPEETAIGLALDELGTAYGILYEDAEHLERAFAMYDAVHAMCRVRELPQPVREAAPFLPPQRIPYLRDALGGQPVRG